MQTQKMMTMTQMIPPPHQPPEQVPESDSPLHMANTDAAAAASIQDQHWQVSHQQATVEDVSDEEDDDHLSSSDDNEDFINSEDDEGVSVFD
jgi:hypothetical protein